MDEKSVSSLPLVQHGVQGCAVEEGRGRNVPVTVEDWVACFPVEDLPPLPLRSPGYTQEATYGAALVLVITLVYVWVTCWSAEHRESIRFGNVSGITMTLIFTFSVIALFSLLFVVFARAGEIVRSVDTCYPIPSVVLERLKRGDTMEGLANVEGPENSPTHSSYCVRCFVWRPSAVYQKESHHCDTCQRCYWGFDHHCGVLGRCIVWGNMPCFSALIGMFMCGSAVCFFSFVSSGNA